jgi:hypothetical protein
MGVIKDIKNYLDLRKIVKQEAATSPLWTKNRLRYDKLCRIYTVVNLPPEVTLSPDDPEEIRVVYVIDATREINQYLTSLNLQEIIAPEFKPIKGTDSYLVIYNPLFMTLSFSWFFNRVLLIGALIFAEKKWGYLSQAIEILKEVIF